MSDLSSGTTGHRPATSAGARAFLVTPFTKLARTHAGATTADAMVAASLAGSLFFNLPADGARTPVLRYLVITMLPFSVLSPLIGPAIDRLKGGHRFVVVGSIVLRAVLCYFLIGQIGGDSPLFFLLALLILVCQKAYQVGRSALVPTVVDSDSALVQANSKLSLISGLAGFVGVLPAAILLKAFGPQWSVGLAMVTYAGSAVLALQLSGKRVASESADQTERKELRGASIVMAGSAMGLIRATVGFLTLLIAFDFRGGGRPAWQFGFVGGISVLSQLGGAVVAPRLRVFTTEENILSGVLGLLVVGGMASLVLADVGGAALLGGCVGFAAGAGKLAFDSILQRDAPDANRGRAFAKFETRFQVTWVIGALAPVAIHMSAHFGFAVVLVLALIAVGSYGTARLAYAHRSGTHRNAATARAVEIEDHFAEVSGEVRGRLVAAPGQVFRQLRVRRAALRSGQPDDLRPERDEVEIDGGPAGDTRAVVDDVDGDLAATAPNAWRPPAEDDEAMPWVARHDAEPPAGEYLADVEPSVDNPFPWTPDAPTAVFDQDATTPEATRTARATRDVARPGSPSQVRRRRRQRRT
ncbi:MAG: MFS transporter [Acidimicrobiales bacterium]